MRNRFLVPDFLFDRSNGEVQVWNFFKFDRLWNKNFKKSSDFWTLANSEMFH